MTGRVFTVVLTGGIASGKTAVSDGFRRLGVPVIDTDIIARQLVEPGQPALGQIARVFGPGVLDPAGGLDRGKMRRLIFSDREKKDRLEQLLHPLIREEVHRRLDKVSAPYCILVVPLFAESGAYHWVDRVLLVDTGEDEQIRRVMLRDDISEEQAKAILDAQASRAQRAALADDVIDNSGTLRDLEDQIAILHQKYSSLGSA